MLRTGASTFRSCLKRENVVVGEALDIAILMHDFPVFVYPARRKINGLVTYPAEMCGN